MCRSLLASAISLSIVNPAPAAEIFVGGTCSLVDAITSANSNTSVGTCSAGDLAGTDTITLQNSSVHSLTAVNNTVYGSNGLPSIISSISISGNGATIKRDAAAVPFRLFHVTGEENLSLNSLTLTGGNTAANGGGIYATNASVLINDSTITANTAGIGGGVAVNTNGRLELNNTRVVRNYADYGAGLALFSSFADLTRSTVSGNVATDHGGGIYALSGSIDLGNSTVSGNTAATEGGGIFLFSVMPGLSTPRWRGIQPRRGEASMASTGARLVFLTASCQAMTRLSALKFRCLRHKISIPTRKTCWAITGTTMPGLFSGAWICPERADCRQQRGGRGGNYPGRWCDRYGRSAQRAGR